MDDVNIIQGVSTVIYPVKDLNREKKLFNKLLGSEPIMDELYYVGYKIGNQDIGLDPNGFNHGMTGPVIYYTISDIKKSLQDLLDGVQKECKLLKMWEGAS